MRERRRAERWYTFTPAASGTFCARSCGSDYDTVVAAIGGSCRWAILGCNDDGCGAAQSRVTFTATAGRPVFLEVGRYGGHGSPAVPGGYAVFSVADAAADSDGDGVTDCADNCPAANAAPQRDTDFDGVGDVCDPCNGGLGHDLDADGICGEDDNCDDVANVTQVDTDPEGTPDGIESLRLKTGAGQARIQLEASGPNLHLVAPPYTTPLRVRLVRDDDPAQCWEATYASAVRNDAVRFRAKRAREPAAAASR